MLKPAKNPEIISEGGLSRKKVECLPLFPEACVSILKEIKESKDEVAVQCEPHSA